MKALLCTFFSLMILATAGTVAAQPRVPSDVQAAIFLKVLKYDKNAVSRSKGNIGFVILLDGQATARKSEIASGFIVINGQSVEGATVKVSAVTLPSADQIPAAMLATGGNIIYLPQGTTPLTSAAVLDYGKKNKVPIFTDDPTLASRGAAVCIVIEGGAPKMIINLPASQVQGMAISADVLKLAKVIR